MSAGLPDGAMIRVVEVSIRDYDLRFFHHQRTMATPTDLTMEIYGEACRCLEELWTGVPLRHLGIHTTGVTRTLERQLGFFDAVDYDKYRRAEEAVDSLRKRYGQDIIKRGSFLAPPGEAHPFVDHMGGGISREKRRPDYSREMIQ